MFAPVLAFMGSWVGILIVLALAAVGWLFLKAAADLVIWFREEILEDSRPKRTTRHRRG